MTNFVHLHSHYDSSLLDGIARYDDAVQRAAEDNQPALAITDHGNLIGALNFYRTCKEHGVKPILGMEAYQAVRTINDRDPEDRKSYHLVLLAQNEQGWRNLVTMSTLASTQGMFFKPRVDRAMLAKYNEGIIVLSGCLGGELASSVLDPDEGRAEARTQDTIEFFRGTFPDRYYLEMQDHGQADDVRLNNAICNLSTFFDVPRVATQDFHYTYPEQKRLHETVLAIQTHAKMSEPTEEQGGKRFAFLGDSYHMTTTSEMMSKFDMDSVRNTLAIADECNVELDLSGKLMLPDFQGVKLRDWLRANPNCIPDEPAYQDRLHYELEVLERLGFDDYMMIIQDLVNFARDHAIFVGPGRGSVAGSLVAFALGIHKIDPIQYGLPFERFLNPNRVKPPDVDLDFTDSGRAAVIKYAESKYGKDKVAQIGTVGVFAERSAVMFAAKALEKSEDDSEVQDVARKIDGLKRLTGKHAAGVCISPVPLLGFVPCVRSRDDNGAELTTQWDKNDIEGIGLLKVDALGVSRLGTMQECMRLVEQYRCIRVDFDHISTNDQMTFRMIKRGDVHGVFQLDTYGARKLIASLQPSSIEEIAALTAVDRPGTLSTGVADDYVARAQGKQEVTFLHPLLQPILESTYGVMVFQEQAMQVVVALAGFTLAEADLLRASIAKKHPEEMAIHQKRFFAGCVQNGIDKKIAQEVWRWLDAFSGYSFNKAHSVAYAMMAYQTAYLKAHYPLEWYTALLNERIGDQVKLKDTVSDVKRHGIVVRGPHMRYSHDRFTIAEDGESIRYALTALPDFGSTAYVALKQGLQRAVSVQTIDDLLMACNMGKLNSKALTALIKSGACVELGSSAGLLSNLSDSIKRAHDAKAEAYKWGDGKKPMWLKRKEKQTQSELATV